LSATTLAYDLVQPELQLVERELAATAQPDHPLLGPMLSMVLPGSGKRMRPTMALLAGKLGRPNERALIDMAVGAELLHTASLVHDDVQDNSETRRGSATLYTQVGNALAVLVGDYLFAQSANRCVATENIRVISLFAQTLAAMCQGQIQEASRGNRSHLKVTRDEYYSTIHGKTASLFILACEGGGILAGLPEPQIVALRTYGEQLGLAFQLVDDILDFAGTEEELGKPIGSDLRQGTITLPVIYLRESLHDGHFARMFDDCDPGEIAAIVRDSSALERCRDEAGELIGRAQAALDELPDSPARHGLAALADFVLVRNR
jgi:geranylgeranyl pyrophosphate synthase